MIILNFCRWENRPGRTILFISLSLFPDFDQNLRDCVFSYVVNCLLWSSNGERGLPSGRSQKYTDKGIAYVYFFSCTYYTAGLDLMLFLFFMSAEDREWRGPASLTMLRCSSSPSSLLFMLHTELLTANASLLASLQQNTTQYYFFFSIIFSSYYIYIQYIYTVCHLFGWILKGTLIAVHRSPQVYRKQIVRRLATPPSHGVFWGSLINDSLQTGVTALLDPVAELLLSFFLFLVKCIGPYIHVELLQTKSNHQGMSSSVDVSRKKNKKQKTKNKHPIFVTFILHTTTLL